MKEYTGMEYMAIDVANQYGLDKLTFEDRIYWVKQNLNNLEAYVAYADEPLLYLKAVQALRKALAGKPTGHSVALDAVCSGMQIMSCVMNCKAGASLTGLIDPDTRTDAYTLIFQSIQEIIERTGASIEVSRKDAKQAVMTYLYGSKAVPLAIFGEKYIGVFEAAMAKHCPGAVKLLNLLLGSWQSEDLFHDWVLPDGHYAYVPVMDKEEYRINVEEGDFKYTPRGERYVNMPKAYGLANAANVIHSIDAYILREAIRRTNYSRHYIIAVRGRLMRVLRSDNKLPKPAWYADWESSGMVSAVMLNDLTNDVAASLPKQLRQQLLDMIENILKYAPHDTSTIHDSFGTHANHCNATRWHYKELLAELCESRLAQDLLDQVSNGTRYVNTPSSIARYVRASNYALS